MFKDLLDRAKRVAEEHLPDDVLDAGRKLGRSVAAHAPAPLAEVIHYVTEESEQAKAEAQADAKATQAPKAADRPPEAKATTVEDEDETEAKDVESKSESPADVKSSDETKEPSSTSTRQVEADDSSSKIGPLREDPRAVLERVKSKADRGLKPEDRLVVIYATPDEQDDVDAIEKILDGVETEVRHNDLRREPQTARQLAKLTGVMVPPYVFINGRHWGNRYDLESLAVSGDLPNVVANLLEDISDEARRIGHLHQSFSDEISVKNIIERWRQGHILCVDDLDAWFEVDRDGTEHFYYQGGPRPVDDMMAVAEEIVSAVEGDEYEAIWQLEPSVHLP